MFERRSADLCERFADAVPRGIAPGRRHRSHAVTKVYRQRALTGRDRRERVEDRASKSTACCVRSGQAANTTAHCDLPPKRGTSTIQSLPHSIAPDSRVRGDDGPTRRMNSAPFAVYLDRSSSVFLKYPCAAPAVKVLAGEQTRRGPKQHRSVRKIEVRTRADRARSGNNVHSTYSKALLCHRERCSSFTERRSRSRTVCRARRQVLPQNLWRPRREESATLHRTRT